MAIEQPPRAEGWTWLENSLRRHYFRSGRSLCSRWGLFLPPSDGYQDGDDASPDNCAACKKKRLAERAKEERSTPA